MTCNRGEVRLTVLLLEINVVLWFCGVVKLRSCVDLLCIDRLISIRRICELYDSDKSMADKDSVQDGDKLGYAGVDEGVTAKDRK